MSAEAPMSEPGFAWALYYRVTGREAAGRRAVEWASRGSDLRQLALVYDWCGPVMRGGEAELLAQKIQQGIAQPAPTMTGQAARALGAIAIADRLPDAGDGVLRGIAAWLRERKTYAREDWYALFELLHAVRDATKVELRSGASAYFERLPLNYIAGFYPAAFPGPDNDLRIPAYSGTGDPDLALATRARAAGLAMVAYDTTAVNYQFLQGFLMTDRFAMRDPLGAPYELLWANPYQPGLAYQTLPLVFHDPTTANLFARTSWEEETTWLGYFDGSLQMSRGGGVQSVRPGTAVAPLRVGDAIVTRPATGSPLQWRMDAPVLFVLGLAPSVEYGVEIDDQELDFLATDVGGTLVIRSAEGTDSGVRISPVTR
jgi:hypothetical protein